MEHQTSRTWAEISLPALRANGILARLQGPAEDQQ